MTNAEVVRRYFAAMVDHDYDTQAALRAADWTAVWPQSGEMVRGNANMRAILENYPGGPPSEARCQRISLPPRFAGREANNDRTDRADREAS